MVTITRDFFFWEIFDKFKIWWLVPTLTGNLSAKMNVTVETYGKLSSHSENVLNKTGYYGISLNG